MALILVFVVLGIITWLFRFFGLKYHAKLVAIEQIEKERKHKELEAARANELSTLESSAEELVAVLTAATEAIICKQVVIRNIRFLRNSQDSAWSRIGRLDVMASHQVK